MPNISLTHLRFTILQAPGQLLTDGQGQPGDLAGA
jgi:hypothetical protein